MILVLLGTKEFTIDKYTANYTILYLYILYYITPDCYAKIDNFVITGRLYDSSSSDYDIYLFIQIRFHDFHNYMYFGERLSMVNDICF